MVGALVLILQSCHRDEPLQEAEQQQTEKVSKFDIFSKKSGDGLAARESNMFYQEGFRYLYFRYFELNPQEAPDFKDTTLPQVDFGLATQVFDEEDSSKTVFYPIVQNSKVIELLGANLNKDETFVSFFFHQDDSFKDAVISSFSSRLNDPDYELGTGYIEEVIIYVPKPISNYFPRNLLNFNMPGSGGCGMYDSCGGGGSSGVIPPQTTQPKPCQKTKTVLNNTDVQNKISSLNEQSKVGGEKGINIDLNGNASAIINGNEHAVNLGSPMGQQGGYHNHTPDGVMMFSPTDIGRLMAYAGSQSPGTHNNAFFGIVGSTASGSCPNGWCYHNYVIRFEGSQQDLTNILNTSFNYDQLKLDQQKLQIRLMRDSSNTVSPYSNVFNSNGLEKLFFETLKLMGLTGKVSLQRVETDGSVKNITNTNGTINAVPCQ